MKLRLDRSARLSRRSRLVSAVIAIAAVLGIIWQFASRNVSAPPRAVVALPAERLSFAKLANNEEIVVVTTAYQRQPVEFRFRGAAEATRLIVSEVIWSETDRAWKMTRVLGVRPLTRSEAEGLDSVVADLRSRRTPDTIHFATDAIEYRRNDVEIGRETLLEHWLARERTDAARFPIDDSERQEAIAKNASAQGVAPEVFWKWVTFEMLLPREDEREK